MKTLIALITFLSLGLGHTLHAQEADSLKYGPDKAKTEELMSLYVVSYKQKNYADAYPNWSKVFHTAPKRTRNLYIHGPRMVSHFIKEGGDKRQWLDTLFMIYDQYSVYYPSRKGDNLGKKGTQMYRYLSKDMTDEELSQANTYLKESYDIEGNDISEAVINYYFLTTAKLVQKEVVAKEELLNMYSDLGGVIEYQRAQASQMKFELEEKKELGTELTKKEAKRLASATKSLSNLSDVEGNIEKTLAPHATCEKLEEIYTAQMQANGENIQWLKRASRLMKKKECTENNLFDDIADRLYRLEPSADAAIGLAYSSIRQNDYQRAYQYVDEAIEQEQNPIEKAEYYNLKAQLQLKKGAYQSAVASARKAISLRKGWGSPYLIIGQAYANTSRKCGEFQSEFKKRLGYIAALEKFEYAKRIDPSVSKLSNKLIGTFSGQVPSIADAFTEGKKSGDRVSINCWYSESISVRTR